MPRNGRVPVPKHVRFAKMVQRGSEDECWNFIGRKRAGKYGQISTKEKEYLAHRVAWEIAYGPIPDGMLMLHKCDNTLCCNPHHLFLGTHRDNSDDKVKKRRHAFGENSISPLKAADVRRIRELYASGSRSQQSLADEYGVNQTAISAMVRRVTWKHI